MISVSSRFTEGLNRKDVVSASASVEDPVDGVADECTRAFSVAEFPTAFVAGSAFASGAGRSVAAGRDQPRHPGRRQGILAVSSFPGSLLSLV